VTLTGPEGVDLGGRCDLELFDPHRTHGSSTTTAITAATAAAATAMYSPHTLRVPALPNQLAS